MIEFNGVAFPDPDTIKYDYQETVRERETLAGRTVRLVLRRKEHVSCTWQQLSKADAVKVLAAGSVDKGTLKVWSQKDGAYVMREVYVSGDSNGDIPVGRRLSSTDLETVNTVSITFREA